MQIWLWCFLFATQTVFFVLLAGNLQNITIFYAIFSGAFSASIFTFFAKMRNKKSNLTNSTTSSVFYNPIKLIRYCFYLFVEMSKSSTLLLKTIVASKSINSNILKYSFQNDIFCSNKKMLHLFMTTVTITPSTICFSFDEKSKTLLIHNAFHNMPQGQLIKDLINVENNLIRIFKLA